MKNITINIPYKYIEVLDKLKLEQGTSRSELLRRSIKDLLNNDLDFNNRIHQLFPRLEEERKIREELQKRQQLKNLFELKGLKKTEFYNYCIACDRRLHPKTKPINHKGVHVLELKFCCSCFKKFEGKSFDELPDPIIKKIRRKLKKYKKLRKNG